MGLGLPRRFGRPSIVAVASTLAALVILPGSALAANQAPSVSPSDEFSATDQYVESVPTSRGPNAPGVEKRRKAPLPPTLSAQIQREGGTAAPKLEQVATSPDLGAPPARSDRSSRKPRTVRANFSPGVPAAAVGTIGGSDDGSLLGLLAALLLITGLSVGTAVYRNHRHKNAAD